MIVKTYAKPLGVGCVSVCLASLTRLGKRAAFPFSVGVPEGQGSIMHCLAYMLRSCISLDYSITHSTYTYVGRTSKRARKRHYSILKTDFLAG